MSCRWTHLHPTDEDLRAMAQTFTEQWPEAERVLDTLADETRQEALRVAPRPAPLLALVDRTRHLSDR